MKHFKILLAAFLGLVGPAAAQGYPTRPIKLIVPYAPGGSADFLARIVAQRLAERLGQTVFIENMGGAGSNRGVAALAAATADGYTIGTISAASHSINPALYREKLPFKPLQDFRFITPMAITPNVLVVNPEKIKANTLPELITEAKANPDKFNYGSSGYGTTLHIGMELLKRETGIAVTHVPFQGSGPVMQALLTGTIDMAMDGASVMLPMIQAGRVKAIAFTTDKRTEFAPDTPTLSETIPGFEIASWHGLAAPANTSQAIVDRLAVEARAVLESAEVQARFRQGGAIPLVQTPDEFRMFVEAQMKRWSPLVEQSGATMN